MERTFLLDLYKSRPPARDLMETKFGTISKEAFDSFDFKFVDSGFFTPISKRKKQDSSCFLPDGAAGTFVYSDADEGLLVYCYSFKRGFGDIEIVVTYFARNTQYGSPKYGYWQAADGFSYIVRDNLKYESSKARNLIKRLSRFMDSGKNLKAAIQQSAIQYRELR